MSLLAAPKAIAAAAAVMALCALAGWALWATDDRARRAVENADLLRQADTWRRVHEADVGTAGNPADDLRWLRERATGGR